MSTTSKKPIIDPKSKEMLKQELTTADMYRELDQYLRLRKKEENIKKSRMINKIIDDGENLVREIEEKNTVHEKKRIQMIEYIYFHSKEKFITIKELKDLPYEDVQNIYKTVIEWEKPWWKKLISVFIH